MRVLVIDDDAATCETLQAGLTQLGGHSVVCALDGETGIAAMRRTRFDAALIDLRLSNGASGLDALRTFVRLHPEAQAYLLTAYAESGAIAEAMQLDARYLPKLLDIEQLARVLASDGLREAQDVVAGNNEEVFGPSSPGMRHVALERWADLVVRGVDGEEDPRTLEIWCRAAGVSRSTLEARHAAVRIAAHDAKNVTRLLWAVRVSRQTGTQLADLLDADRRTVQRIIASIDSREASSLIAVVDEQHLITEPSALSVLRRALSRLEASRAQRRDKQRN